MLEKDLSGSRLSRVFSLEGLKLLLPPLVFLVLSFRRSSNSEHFTATVEILESHVCLPLKLHPPRPLTNFFPFSVEYYQAIYQECGSKGSSLTVVPFNQGSKQDVEALVDYIYSKDKGLGMDLDYILPFAALPENGREIDGLDDRSELAHRIMLTNLLRLLGAVKTKKAALQLVTRPTEVVLPLSPNHGLFGNDGLYGESKISLETLLTRWSSESWGEYLCIAGAVIGPFSVPFVLFFLANGPNTFFSRMDSWYWIDERYWICR